LKVIENIDFGLVKNVDLGGWMDVILVLRIDYSNKK
jgi:hypothetical protein